MNTAEEVFALLESKFSAKRETMDKWAITAVISTGYLRHAVQFLKNEAKIEMLLDIAGIDYLTYPKYEGPRFAVSYSFKSISKPGLRIRLKVLVSESNLKVPTISDVFDSADWLERETFDQYGIVFEGHKDLRRLLNHVEFEGHPLRKDYPAQKRQWLSTNDFLLPELEKRLESKGYKIVKRSKEVMTNDDEYLEGSIKA